MVSRVALVAAIALLAVAANASASEATGEIAGTVTDTASHPIAGIEACAVPAEMSLALSYESEVCEKTNAGGEYVLKGLPGGAYYVTFAPPFLVSALNYVPQYYEDAATEAKAKRVQVTAGQTAAGIDATLAEGGGISGKVTNASTHAPLETAVVCARLLGSEGIGQCTATNAAGEYTLVGLAAGGYQVAFLGPHGLYAVQYYDDKARLTEADTVSVSVGAVTHGIDAALLPAAPGTVGTAPGAPGTTTPGSVKTPTPGLVSKPLVTLTGVRLVALVAARGAVPVHIKCGAAVKCRGSIELTVRSAVRHRKPGALQHGKTLVLAQGAYVIAPGKSGVCTLRLTAAGRKRLAGAARRPLIATLTISVHEGKTTSAQALVS